MRDGVVSDHGASDGGDNKTDERGVEVTTVASGRSSTVLIRSALGRRFF